MTNVVPNATIRLDLAGIGIADELLAAYVPFDDGCLFERFTIVAEPGSVESQLRRWLMGEWPAPGQVAKGTWGDAAEFEILLGNFTTQRTSNLGDLLLEGDLQYGTVTWTQKQDAEPARWVFSLTNLKLKMGDEVTMHDAAHPERGGRLDAIEFDIAGRRWRLTDTLFTQWKQIDHALTATPIISGLLTTPYREGDTDEIIQRMAQDTCDLLSFGLSRAVNWYRYQLQDRSGAPIRAFYRNALTAPFEMNGLVPVDNYAKYAIKSYLESGYVAMQTNHPWYRRTVTMCAEAQIARYLDVRCALLFAMLDRITSFVVERNGTAEIDEELTEKLKESSNVAKIHAAMREISEHWTQENTESIVSTVMLWNIQPSYIRKIERACKQLRVPMPIKKLLRARNSMLHDLEIGVSDGSSFYERFSQLEYAVLCLMLRLLGYDGVFYHKQVDDKKLFRDLHGPALPEDTG